MPYCNFLIKMKLCQFFYTLCLADEMPMQYDTFIVPRIIKTSLNTYNLRSNMLFIHKKCDTKQHNDAYIYTDFEKAKPRTLTFKTIYQAVYIHNCMLILYISGGTYSLKLTSKDRFLQKVFVAILFTLRVFARNLNV